jgi:hypothetical protein
VLLRLPALPPLSAPGLIHANPLMLSYGFCLEPPSRWEAADPSVVAFRGEYFLSASKCGGHHHSPTVHLAFIAAAPPLSDSIEAYAPAALVVGDAVLFLTTGTRACAGAGPAAKRWRDGRVPVRAAGPGAVRGRWRAAVQLRGCGDSAPIVGRELGPATP